MKTNEKYPQIPSDKTIYELSDFFKNFGESTRLKIVLVLREGELCVADIAEAVGSSHSAVSHQLRVLRSSKIVKSKREGNLVFYSIDDEHVNTVVGVGLEHILEKRHGN